MDDLISRQAAIDAIHCDITVTGRQNAELVAATIGAFADRIKALPSAQPDNQVHLCDSCKYTYPECPSGSKDVIFGNGIGNDNICACNKYKPSAQQETIRCKDCKWYGRVDKRRFYRGMDCLQKHIDTIVPDRDFCSKAERRTDGSD